MTEVVQAFLPGGKLPEEDAMTDDPKGFAAPTFRQSIEQLKR